jgi:ABC-type phosphate transport system substrate-binding protein
VLVSNIATAAEPTPQVISNYPVESDQYLLSYVRAIFTMRIRNWPDGTPIKVFVLPDSTTAHKAFCKKLLKIYPYVLRDQWERAMYTGTGGLPTIVPTEQELLIRVKNTKGAIGYIHSSEAVSPELHVLTINAELKSTLLESTSDTYLVTLRAYYE